MSFTDQKPFIVTAEHLRVKWSCRPASESFYCAWCGHTFVEGDTARWVYTNGDNGLPNISGNPFICGACDGPKDIILDKLRNILLEFKQPKFRWASERLYNDGRNVGYGEAWKER